MSKGTSIILVLLGTVAWFWFCQWYYTCKLLETCGATASSNVAPTDSVASAKEAVNTYPLAFKWSNSTPDTTSTFGKLRSDILSEMNETNELEIVGLYFEGEETPEGAQNIGFARAERIKSMFSPPIPDDRIKVRARVMEEKPGVREGYFESIAFNWMEGERKTVEELEDRIIVRFPSNSTQKEYDPAVDEYLDKLAKRIKETGEKITLTGHTDNIGEPESNVTLGERRAKAIQGILVKKGVSSGQITVESKGENQPVATNDTEEGRRDNRRVELRLIKSN